MSRLMFVFSPFPKTKSDFYSVAGACEHYEPLQPILTCVTKQVAVNFELDTFSH